MSNNSAPTTVKVIRGQFLAKATRSYSSWHRAEDAAHWLRGEVKVWPTIKLAARTFNVPVLKVVEARDRLARIDLYERAKRSGNGNDNNGVSDALLDNAIARVGAARLIAGIERGIAKGVLPEIADFQVSRFDPGQATQPQMQAAE